MRSGKSMITLLVFTTILVLGVGYSVVSNVNLTINGDIMSKTEALKVKFESVTPSVETNGVKGTVTGDLVANISVKDLELNTPKTVTFTVKNNETDLKAKITEENKNPEDADENMDQQLEGLDVQLEALIDARLCCLKVRLVEQDGNLVVSKVYARSLKTGDASVKLDPGEGINFDAIPVGNDDEGAGVAHDSTLTISSLTLEGVVAKSRIAVADAATFGGAVSVGEDVELSVPEGSPLAGGSFGQKLTLDGTLVLAESQTFPNEIAGETRSRMDISHPISHQMVTEVTSFYGYRSILPTYTISPYLFP